MALPLTADQPDRSVPASARETARGFLLARLGSLFAFLPLGVWTIVHLWHQLAAYRSAEAWQESVTGHVNGASTALTFAVVLIPLVWHTVWGIGRMIKSRPNPRVTWFSNTRYLVQRLSAIGLFAFLCAHLYLAWFEPRILEGHAEVFADLAREMRFNAPTTIVYALGILAIAYHVANGLWSFLSMGWGVTVSKSSMAWMERISVLFFLVLLVIGWGAVYGLYSGGAALGPG